MAIKKIYFKNRQEFLYKRSQLDTYGGSDAGTILGLNKWKSPMRLYMEKVGIVPSEFSDNKYTFHGTNLEDYVVELWKHYEVDDERMRMNHGAKRKVSRCRKENCFQINPDVPWLHATIDAKILKSVRRKGKGILECKTMTNYASDMYESVNPSYVVQVQQYMLVLGLDYSEIAQLVGGFEFELYPIDASTELQSAIYETTLDFSEREKEGLEIVKKEKSPNKKIQLLANIAPEADNTEDVKKLLSTLHQVREGGNKMEFDDELLEWALEYDFNAKKMKEAKEAKLDFSNKIKAHLLKNDANYVELPIGKTGKAGKISWNKNLTVRV